jgi:hypothetical protein
LIRRRKPENAPETPLAGKSLPKRRLLVMILAKNLEKCKNMEDNPRMVTLKADNRSRVKLPDAKPGQVFIYESSGKDQFVLTLVKKREPEPVREVKLIKGENGLYRWPDDARPTREELLAAIRADREAQK